MKVAILAGNGKAGRLILKEAIDRGHTVTSFIRRHDENSNNNSNVIVKDILNLTSIDLSGFDVVVNAFGVFNDSELFLYSKINQHLCDILSNTNTRLIIVGGAGSLYLDEEHKTRLLDTPDFPKEYLPVAMAAAKALEELRLRDDDIKWSFLSPAAIFDAEGSRTGKYILGGEVAKFNEQGTSYISYADYAIALVDEIENSEHIQQRFSVIAN